MQRRSKPGAAAGAVWRRLLALLVAGLALATTACKDETSDIGVGLPNAQTNTGAYLIDTLTIRASTVLRDSVVTSTSTSLLVGRTTDPLLGTLTAKSFFRLGLGDSFTPDGTFAYDSVALVLNPDNYRYGDTTKTQSLVEVHRLLSPLLEAKPLFAASRLTPLRYDSATVLNQGGRAPVGRARPNITSLRLRLDDALGRQLLTAGQTGRLTTQEQLTTLLPGLALAPTATDNAALLRLSATNSASALILYYHDPTDAATALSHSFGLVEGGLHCFQVRADRRLAGVAALPTVPLRPTAASLTGEQTFVEGALGLQTKLEFPYLTDLLGYGVNLTITSAQLTASVPTTTLSPFVPAPPALTVSTADAANRPVETYVSGIPYLTAFSNTTGQNQGTYEWSVMTYVQAVLNRTVPNNGLLLSAGTPELPDRVVLGSPSSAANKLQLRLYLIQVK